jgi:hypothetical protein
MGKKKPHVDTNRRKAKSSKIFGKEVNHLEKHSHLPKGAVVLTNHRACDSRDFSCTRPHPFCFTTQAHYLQGRGNQKRITRP